MASIPKTQLAALVWKQGDAVVWDEAYPVPEPKQNEVLVKVLYTGVCQSGGFSYCRPVLPGGSRLHCHQICIPKMAQLQVPMDCRSPKLNTLTLVATKASVVSWLLDLTPRLLIPSRLGLWSASASSPQSAMSVNIARPIVNSTARSRQTIYTTKMAVSRSIAS